MRDSPCFPAAIRCSLSYASIVQQATNAVAEVVSSQPVERTELVSKRHRPQLPSNLWKAAEGRIGVPPHLLGKLYVRRMMNRDQAFSIPQRTEITNHGSCSFS